MPSDSSGMSRRSALFVLSDAWYGLFTSGAEIPPGSYRDRVVVPGSRESRVLTGERSAELFVELLTTRNLTCLRRHDPAAQRRFLVAAYEEGNARWPNVYQSGPSVQLLLPRRVDNPSLERLVAAFAIRRSIIGLTDNERIGLMEEAQRRQALA